MIALLQRVKNASVTVDQKAIAEIGHGLLVLVCAEKVIRKKTVKN